MTSSTPSSETFDPQIAELFESALPDAPGLASQLIFLTEISRLTEVFRQAVLPGSLRHENTAEHSWHVAVCALVLSDLAPTGCDVAHAVKLLVVHDLVEVYAGDTDVHDKAAVNLQEELENDAAARLFGLLPSSHAESMRALWDEFEEATTPEALFAKAIDRFQPLLYNLATRGESWKRRSITSDRVVTICAPIERGSPELFEASTALIQAAVSQHMLDEPF